jgi:hypothetical protein
MLDHEGISSEGGLATFVSGLPSTTELRALNGVPDGGSCISQMTRPADPVCCITASSQSSE